MTTTDKNIEGLQYLRGFAACAVVLDHAAAITSQPEYYGGTAHPFLLAGWVGVPIFFVISGFIITIVSLRSDLTPRLNVGDFFWRRFARIVPFLWVCIVAYVAISYFGTGNFDWLMTLRTVTLWPLGDLKPNVTWTLRVEFLFYILFALTVLSSRRGWWVMAAWVASPLLIAAVETWVPSVLTVIPEHARGLLRFATTIHNLEFAAGLLLGLLWLSRDRLPSTKGGIYTVLGMTVAVMTLVWLADYKSSPDLVQAFVLTAVSAAAVYAAITVSPSKGLTGRIGSILGDASYSIYLLHNLAILVVLEVMAKVGNPVPVVALVPFLFAASLVLGVLAHWYIEAPLVRFVRNLPSRHKHKAQLASAP
ncbi:acyltransferase [Devosia oryziradicis]|uniref:Acyltransferase n=1 Tax=Devosia oryziradicis TaxID=2801335 RepID=A0ABX7BVF0_9HYPH|nr:acyltransferase [Devosia oryziradicis]QQR35926.1 acyltransferase [Devosia oryziradicis]